MSTIEDVKIGAAYVRVSTDSQLEYSPDSQIKLIQDYAKKEGYIIPEEYIYREDDGISGKLADKRPAFRLMIAAAKEDNPPFECIFVWKFSRFARNQEESIMYKNLLRKRGIEVKSISEPITDSPFSSLIERIIEWMDEFYLINLASEVRRGMKEKASRGEATGRPPFGFDVKDKMLVPNDEASIVQYIFEAFASGTPLREIAVALDEKGVRTCRGNVLSAHFIRYILRNPVYIGKVRWTDEKHAGYKTAEYDPAKQELPDGKHKAIISQELWDAAQKKLVVPEVKYVRKDNPVIFPMKGLIRCGDCGATLVRYQYAPGKYTLQCYRYGRGMCKVSHSITEIKAEEAVISALEKVAISKSFVFQHQTTTHPILTRDWGKLISAEENRLQRAKTALLDGAFTSEEYKQIKTNIQSNIGKLKAAQEKETNETPTPQDSDALARKIFTVIEFLKSSNVEPEDKNKALRSIIEKIVYNKPENTFDIIFWP